VIGPVLGIPYQYKFKVVKEVPAPDGKMERREVEENAFVTIAVNDLRGTREALMLDWGGTKHSLLPGSQVPGYTTGATASLGTDQPIASETEFSIPLDFNGSEGIYFAPFWGAE